MYNLFLDIWVFPIHHYYEKRCISVITFLNKYLLAKLFSKRQWSFSKCALDRHISRQCPSLCCYQWQMEVPTESTLCFPFFKKGISPYKNQSLCLIYNNVRPHLCIHKNIEFGFSPISLSVERHKFSKKFYLELYWVEKHTLISSICDK